jgi:hypothetical protein
MPRIYPDPARDTPRRCGMATLRIRVGLALGFCFAMACATATYCYLDAAQHAALASR